jgi:hypothetical protein
MHNVRFTMHRILLFITCWPAGGRGRDAVSRHRHTSDTHFRPAFLAYNYLAAPIELARITRRYATIRDDTPADDRPPAILVGDFS